MQIINIGGTKEELVKIINKFIFAPQNFNWSKTQPLDQI